MIICFGEILLDQFENKATKKISSYVGGAPFNVCYQIHQLGHPSLFVGNIGKDKEGKIIQNFFLEHNLSQEGLTSIANKKTLLAKVTLNGSERSFTFENKDKIDALFPDDKLDLIAKGDIIHVGSFMLATEKGRAYLDQIITFAKAQKKLMSFDINYREDYFAKEEALKIYQHYYPQFDIVKFSIDELRLFTKETDIEKALKKLPVGPKLYLVTLGSQGSLAYFNNRLIKVKSVPVHPLDTTGAGDAFFGTMLANIDSLGLREMLFIPSLLESTMRYANIAGAIATTKIGALESLATEKEINRLLEKNTSFR